LALGVEESIIIPVYSWWVITSPVDGDVKEVKTASVYEAGGEDWLQSLIDYLEHEKLTSESRNKAKVQQRASRFFYYKGTFYWYSFHDLWLRCLDSEEKKQVMEDASVCGARQSRQKLYDHVRRIGCYRANMVSDCIDFSKRGDACQLHANFI